MKALFFDREGDPQEVIYLKETAIPEPKENEVRVKWLGSPVNPADSLFIQGKYRFKAQFPQIAGLEGAGIVDAAGDNIQLPKGTLVAFLSKNAWAEYVIVHKDELYILPADFPKEKAVQFVLNPVTAWGLLKRAGVKSGDWLLLSAGNSMVSLIITQIARTWGVQVISTVRNSDYTARIKELGAVEVIDTFKESIVQRVNEITGGKGVMAAIDAVGGETGTQLAQSLAVNGKLIAYGVLSADPVQVHNSLLVYKNISMVGFGVRGFLESLSAEEKQHMTQSLIEILSADNFKMDVAKSYSLDNFADALKANASGPVNGKIILKA
jgi:NADPH:quinone reductase-like Zn-dependent oxidoreductase